MGRHKKQYTEEELLEKERKKYRYTIENSIEKGVVNRCKHSKLNYDTIKYEIGTTDRITLRTMYLSCTVSILWEKDEALFRRMREDINNAINDWLSTQDTWDRKNKIYVFEIPETNGTYVGCFRNIKFELHVRRLAEPVSYKNSVEGMMPLVEVLNDTIKKSCESAGLVLAHRPSTNSKGMSLKEYVEGLTDASPSEATEPDTGGSCAVEV